MSQLRILLDEILPFYFLVMVGVIMFTNYIPTTFELYIVYAFSFGVAILNNKIYKSYDLLSDSNGKSSLLINNLEKENKRLKEKVNDLIEEIQNKD